MVNLVSKDGGDKNLRSFQVVQEICDGAVVFCDSFIPRESRTHDKMVQAAKSAVRNISEAGLASAANSKETELKLTGIARASLGELLLDYEDYLRQGGLRQWRKDDPEALRVRAEKSGKSDLLDKTDEEFANIQICIVNQASCLLWRHIKRLDEDILKNAARMERPCDAGKNIVGV